MPSVSMRHRLVVPLVLLYLAINPVGFGLLILQPKEDGKPNLLVPADQAKSDWVYLYQFNRTSASPSQAALNLFIETLLTLVKIPFHRIPNQFFIGSQSKGAAPFVQYQSKYYDGVEQIVDLVKKIKGTEFAHKNDEETKLREFSEDVAFKILMKDRATRHGGDTATSKIGFGGLDFMVDDEGIREQMIAYIPTLMGVPKQLVGGKFQIPVSLKDNSVEFWKAYFNAREHKNENEISKVKKHVNNVNAHNWETFEKAVDAFVSQQLKSVFLAKTSGSEDKLIQLLGKHELKLDDNTIKKYSELGEVEIYNIFREKLEKHLEHLRKKGPFLFGKEPTIADASFFGILIQFFYTPLNIPEFASLFDNKSKLSRKEKNMKNIMKNIMENRADKVSEKFKKETDVEVRNVLKNYVENMKEYLHIDGNWEKLTKKPWPLNYEYLWNIHFEQKKKYDGPYNIETDASEKLNGLENDLLKEINQKILEIVEKKGTREIKEKKRKFMLTETAAFLCQMGKGKDLGDECRKTHEQKRGDAENAKELVIETRKLVYSTIVEFYDAKVAQKVAEATFDVVKKIGKAAEEKNADLVATYSSKIEIGNEY